MQEDSLGWLIWESPWIKLLPGSDKHEMILNSAGCHEDGYGHETKGELDALHGIMEGYIVM